MTNKFLPPTTTTVIRTAATPIDGEVLYDTDEKKLYYGDGTTQGGKAIGSSIVSDSEFRIQDNGDATKQIAFEASGITTGTTRTITVPDASGTVALIDTTGISDKDLFYYDSASKLFKRIAIGTTDQALIAKPSLSPPYQWGTVASSGRELLTTNRTYYVRTDGSDSNNGLTNTSGGAFLTIQKAIDTTVSLDLSIYNVTIQLTGNYSFTAASPLILKPQVGAGTIIILGDSGTPANVKLNGSGAFSYQGIINATGGTYVFDGINFNGGGTGNQYDFDTNYNVNISIKNCLFNGSTYYTRIYADGGSKYRLESNTISSGAYAFFYTFGSGTDVKFIPSKTTTITGTPTFTYFGRMEVLSSCTVPAAHTFSGNITGTKYFAEKNAVAYGASTLPGTGGTTATGGIAT